MKNVFKIVKKELDKIFKFPRMIFTSLVLPGLILFLIYTLMGTGINTVIKESEELDSIIYIINMPDSFEEIYNNQESFKIDFQKSNELEIDNLKQELLNGNIHSLIVFEINFDQKVENGKNPLVEVLYDSTSPNSSIARDKAMLTITQQQQIFYQNLGINPNIFEMKSSGIEEEEKGAAMIIAMILPMIIMSFIFASALANGSDAVAGEKERGTIATLLMSPIKRSEIIIGKIISTSTLTMLSALSSFIGLIASLPFAKSMFAIDGSVSYGVLEIIGLIVILLLIALLASTILLIFSTIAKTVKEASTMSMPVYIAAIIIPAITMFSTTKTSSKVLYLIPIYNTILGLKEILSLNFDVINFILIIGSSLIYISLFVLILMKLFNSERVLYTK